MVSVQLLETKRPTPAGYDSKEFYPSLNEHTGVDVPDDLCREDDAHTDSTDTVPKQSWPSILRRLTESDRRDFARRFVTLAAEWRAVSAHLSSTTDIAMLPAYQQVIGMGEIAVPLILYELEKEPAQWFWALKAITGADPVPPGDRGRVRKMAEAWIEWGRRNGYEW